MGEKMIYFLFTDTGTWLNRLINYYTKTTLNHVSIAVDPGLKEVYSFGRKQPDNPFRAGFVREDVGNHLLKQADCALYAYPMTESEYERIMEELSIFITNEDSYKYNFLGLFGVVLRVEWKRPHAFFCSQFVATLLNGLERVCLEKPACFTTPADIRKLQGMKLIYHGKLDDYQTQVEKTCHKLVAEQTTVKQSLFFSLSEKVKGFVCR
ncbi:hypothetical protein ACFOGI_06550 [Virgibacillus xinjiangensis]|uniref:Permuted papain-like amidase enzyme, YaeF/YiiX, C92 family n=1 Tax=Virgibacillus xinjiangensis TaxID=393090 RepID=A0ABV7CUE8_9BACI